MTEFLFRFGALSLGGAAAVLLLWGIAFFTRDRCAARWRCWGWLLLCLRLAVPFSLPAFTWVHVHAPIQARFSDQVLYQPASDRLPVNSASSPSPTGGVSPSISSGSAASATVPNLASTEQSGTSPAPPALTVSGLLFVLWLTGAAAVLAWSLVRHTRFLRYLRRWADPVTEKESLCVFRQIGEQLGVKRPPRLMVCQGLPAPMLAGIYRPRLLLPAEPMEDAALRHALLHELSHFRRRDIPVKTLALWVAALHWFNPAAWLLVRTVNRDIELACDDAVLRRLAPEERAAYGRTILQATARTK